MSQDWRGQTCLFALSSTPGTWSGAPAMRPVTLPPSREAAVSAERDAESSSPSRCSKNTSACGGGDVA